MPPSVASDDHHLSLKAGLGTSFVPPGGKRGESSSSTLRVNVSSLSQGHDKLLSLEDVERSHQKEKKFLDDFLEACPEWPVPYDVINDTCKACAGLHGSALLRLMYFKFGYCPNAGPNPTSSSGYNDGPTSGSGSTSGAGPTAGPVPNLKDSDKLSTSTDPPGNLLPFPNTPHPTPLSSLPVHHELALLTLLDLCIHDDVISPALVLKDLGTTLQHLQLDDRPQNYQVARRAKRIFLVINKLVQLTHTTKS